MKNHPPQPPSQSSPDVMTTNEPTTADQDEAGTAEGSNSGAIRFIAASKLPVLPLEWLVDGYLEQNTLAVLYGGHDKDKTFLALDMSCCVATNTPYHGQAVREGTVFYLTGQNLLDVARRVRDWSTHNDISLQDCSLFISSYPADSTPTIAQLVQDISRMGGATGRTPALVVIDNLSRIFSRNGHGAAAISRFVRQIEELRTRWEATVLVLSDQGDAQGSLTLNSAVDSEYELSRSACDRFITLNARTMRNAPTPAPKVFDLAEFLLGA